MIINHSEKNIKMKTPLKSCCLEVTINILYIIFYNTFYMLHI